MKNSKIKFNILASMVGLMLTGGVVFLSASQSTTATASASQLAVATQTATVPTTTATPASAAGTAPSAATQTTATTQTSAVASSNTSSYTNGSYTATANYGTPGSSESIDVSLTLQNGIITNASVTNSGNDRESQRYQDNFASSYTQYVVGKSISSLSLSRISGASLTTSAFDNAVSQIKSEAQA